MRRYAAQEEEDVMAPAKQAIPDGYHTVTAHLALDSAAQAMDWYKKALGAQEVARALGPDGKVIHGVIRVGDTLIMMNDAMGGAKTPRSLGGSPAGFWVYVDDCDALFNRAIAAGAKVHGPMGEMQDQFWGDRSGTFIDPHGYVWSIATHKEDLTPQEMQQRQADFFRKFARATA